MYLQTYSMGWSFKILYSITYTFTLFSEITKLDHFVEHHDIYTKLFFRWPNSPYKSSVSKTVFQRTICSHKGVRIPFTILLLPRTTDVLWCCKELPWWILRTLGERPLQKFPLLRGNPQLFCPVPPSAIRGSRVPGPLHLECVTLQSLRHCSGLARFEDGVWHHGVSVGTPAAWNTEVDPSHILQHKCPKEERLLFALTHRTELYICFSKYSFHGIQQKLHITTLKKSQPILQERTEVGLV